MNDIEELLRAAYHYQAEAIAPEEIRPVPRPSASPGRFRPQRRRYRIAHPVFAAVAVLLVAAAATLIAQFLPHPSGRAPAVGPRPASGAPPRFFAALSGAGKSVQFLSSATGQVLGQVPAPSSQDFISGVAAEPDDRTFVVAVERASGGGCKSHLFRVRLDNAGHPGQLVAMRQPPLQGILSSRVMALSPDGSALAYFGWNCQGGGSLVVTNLAHRSVGSTWTTQSAAEQVLNISLSAHGARVSVSVYGFKIAGQHPKPGTDLGAATTILRPTGQHAVLGGGTVVLHDLGQAVLAPNGRILYACRQQRRSDVLSAYDVASRSKLADFARWSRANGSCIMAMAPSGRYLLLGNVRGHLAIFNTVSGRLVTSSAAGVGPGDVIAW